MAQGLITIGVLFPVALFLRDPPGLAGKARLANETPSGLPNSAITAWLALAAIFCCACMSVPLMHLVPLIQGKGIAAPEAGSRLAVSASRPPWPMSSGTSSPSSFEVKLERPGESSGKFGSRRRDGYPSRKSGSTAMQSAAR
jgi:hypothetical protein